VRLSFTRGTLLSLGAVTPVAAAGANAAAPARVPDAGIEVIVVTAKRLAAQPIDEWIVTAKRAAKPADRAPPAMAIEMPKLEFAFAAPPLVRL